MNENRNLKLFVKSFGCQMNKLDTALVTSALTEAGFSLTDKVKQADVILIDTSSPSPPMCIDSEKLN
jgi:tRNA-2-methylthio-N6-dimethylallyladenosine synthase